jgi:HEAT repeat protein
MLTRSVIALILAVPPALASVGCASSAFKPMARVNRQSEALSSSTADRLLQLAQRYEKQGNYEGALRLYRQAEKAAPGNPRAKSSIAAIVARQGRPADGSAERQVADTREAVQTGPAHEPVVQPGREFSPDVRPIAEFAAGNPAENTASAADLPSVEPARGADWMMTSSDIAAEQPQDAEDSSGKEPVWWRATQAVAITDDSPSPGDWTPTSWAAAGDETAPVLNDAVELLHSSSVGDRKDGLDGLAALGPGAAAAVPAVQSLIHDDDKLVRAHAAWALWAITQEGFESVPALTSLLTSEEKDVVQVSAYMLGAIGPAAAGSADALHVVCDLADSQSRLYAAEALSRISPDSADAVQLLISALSSPDQESRWLAAVSLAGVAPPHRDAAIAALTVALHDPDGTVRSVAALTLGGFGSDARSAVPQLEQAASQDVEDVRIAAQTALACITR